jgi:hypothetical protein
MIRRLVVLSTFVVAAVSSAAAAPESFGRGVSLAETTPIDHIVARPGDFEGKTVRVEGTVAAVCTHMGCWMSLTPDAKGSANLMIKVDDGVIVFPVSAKGKRASAQGVVQRVTADAEGQSAAEEHAKAEGKDAKPVAWQIKATGAVVY